MYKVKTGQEENMPVNIFVSYSHKDAHLIGALVKLLRAVTKKDWVFLDEDTIKPGKKWRDELTNALHAARLVILFWCSHSSKSKEVKKEYTFALNQEKDLLPVLLDFTPLPKRLGEFQWIDFRLYMKHDLLTSMPPFDVFEMARKQMTGTRIRLVDMESFHEMAFLLKAEILNRLKQRPAFFPQKTRRKM